MKSTQDLFDHISFVHEGKKQPNAISIKLSQNQINAGTVYVYQDSKLLAPSENFAKLL